MNRPIRRNAIALVLLITAAVSGCGSMQSTPGAVEGMDGTIQTGAAFGDEVARGLTTARPAVAEQTDDAAATVAQLSRIGGEPEVQEALYGLSWDVGCEVVTSEVNSDRAAVRTRLLSRALELGLVFVDPSTVDDLAADLLDTFDVDVQGDLYATCAGLRI